MRIDSHQHFWKYDPIRDSWITDEMSAIRKDFLPAELKKVYEENKVQGCVAVQADQSEKETAFLLRLAKENDFIKAVVGWVDLKSATVEERLLHYSGLKKIKGFRAITQGQPDDTYLLNKDFHRGIRLLQQFGFTYDVLIYHDQLTAAIKFTEKFPDQGFVLDHLGKPDIRNREIKKWKAGLKILAQHPKLFCKLSGIITEADWKNWTYNDIYPYLETAAEYFGVERLMYGSDWPVCLVAGKYKQVIEIIEKFLEQVNDEEKEKVWGKNAIQFYNLAI